MISGCLNQFSKREFFVLFVAILWIVVLFKTITIPKDTNIEMVLEKQKVAIKTINDAKNIEYSKNYYIDIIEFKNGKSLYHKDFGYFGVDRDFFITFKASLEVLKDDNYKFLIHSDDGFILNINSIMVATFEGNRPIAPTERVANLKKGVYDFELKYYQGYGNLGLEAYYFCENKRYFIGEDSDCIKFIKKEKK